MYCNSITKAVFGLCLTGWGMTLASAAEPPSQPTVITASKFAAGTGQATCYDCFKSDFYSSAYSVLRVHYLQIDSSVTRNGTFGSQLLKYFKWNSAVFLGPVGEYLDDNRVDGEIPLRFAEIINISESALFNVRISGVTSDGKGTVQILKINQKQLGPNARIVIPIEMLPSPMEQWLTQRRNGDGGPPRIFIETAVWCHLDNDPCERSDGAPAAALTESTPR